MPENVLHLKPAPRSLPTPPEIRGRVQIANLRKPSNVRGHLRGFALTVAIIAAGAVLALGYSAIAQPAPSDAAIAVAVADAAPAVDAPTPAEAGSGAGTTTPTVDAPDPAADPVGFGEKVIGLYRSGALVPSVILLLFGVAVFLHKRLGWFSKGRAALYFAAGIAGLTMLAEAASRGTTPNLGMFIAAVTMVVGMVLNTAFGKKGG